MPITIIDDDEVDNATVNEPTVINVVNEHTEEDILQDIFQLFETEDEDELEWRLYRSMPNNWLTIFESHDYDAVMEFMNNIGEWAKGRQANVRKGHMHEYFICSKYGQRCKGKRRCRQEMQIVMAATYKLQCNDVPHMHTVESVRRTCSLPSHIIDAIDVAYQADCTTLRKVQIYLQRRNIDFTQYREEDIQLYLNRKSKELTGRTDGGSVTLATLEDYIKDKTAVVEAKIVTKEESERGIDEYCILQTTKRLIEQHRHGGPLHVDGSFGAIQLGNPFLLIGTSDKRRRFHPTAIVVTEGERQVDYENALTCLKSAYR